jgi:Bacterial Ig domain
VVGLALALGATMSVVPLQVAGAQSTSTSVLVPANGAAVSGSQVIFDASATAGVTEVQFELTGGGPYSHTVIATATPTEDGWIASWNSTTATDGSYTLQSVATEGASSTTSPGISITVNNPSVAIVLPSYNAIVSGTVVLDAVTSSGATKVEVADLRSGRRHPHRLWMAAVLAQHRGPKRRRHGLGSGHIRERSHTHSQPHVLHCGQPGTHCGGADERLHRFWDSGARLRRTVLYRSTSLVFNLGSRWSRDRE